MQHGERSRHEMQHARSPALLLALLVVDENAATVFCHKERFLTEEVFTAAPLSSFIATPRWVVDSS